MHSISTELLLLLDLAAKMALTATIVVVISVVVERSGPFIGALIAALPTAAGAAYIILAFEHPPDFIAASAVGSAAATAAVSVFAFTYSVLAQRHGLLLSISVAIAVWFVGAAILLARFLVGLHRLRRLRIDSYALNDVGLLGRLGHSRISLLENESIGSPVTWGILRPVILVPIRFHELPINDRLQVFCHELGHIQGNDFVLRVLVEVVCALIWFQPLVWIARRQLREEQELACDNRASVASGRTILKALSLSDNKLTARR